MAPEPPLLLVDLDEDPPSPSPARHPAVVVGRTAYEPPEDHPRAATCDVVMARDDDHGLAAVAATVEHHPVAAASLAVLMRGTPVLDVEVGLASESAVYSTLQAGPEFAAWRAGHPPRDRAPEERAPVRLERSGAVLRITLDRPQVRNALNTAMRDALVEAFLLPEVDPSITAVRLGGAGPSFCAGGDLDEFGSFPDPATAHLVRLRQSVGRAIHLVRDRVTVHVHGPCAGSGVELPAFAGRVVAHRGARFSLPEVSLGLIPGAGGTVSLPRRIGRLRTAWLALSGREIDAATALAWGLVDEIGDEGPGDG
jgi:enoyl-CoA hydratase/carnithine racemase